MERELIVLDRHILVSWVAINGHQFAIGSLSNRIDRYWSDTGAQSDRNQTASTYRSPLYEEIYGAPSERVERRRSPSRGMGALANIGKS